METIFNLLVIFQASSIALGVGSSTIVITSFLVALYDGKIDESERRMLGVIYWTLRAAMAGILFNSALIYALQPDFLYGITGYFWFLIGVLFANAAAMTLHVISPKFGPAIQAGTWYTMGFVTTIHLFELFTFTWPTFLLLYAGDVAVALAIVNGYFWLMKRKRALTASDDVKLEK